MKVYVWWDEGQFEGGDLYGVYTTRELAETAQAALVRIYGGASQGEIRECQCNVVPLDGVQHMVWVDVATGQVIGERADRSAYWGDPDPEPDWFEPLNQGPWPFMPTAGICLGKSMRGRETALRIAMDGRKARLEAIG